MSADPPPRPMAPAALADWLADTLADTDTDTDAGHPLRVALDRARWSGLDLATGVAAALTARGRPAGIVDASTYLRPASTRLERGSDDPDAFYEDWLDLAALRREVLDPLGPGGSGRWLPSLWDPVRDRATRAAYRVAPPHGVVVVDGWFLLGAGLPFDVTVHVALSAAARRRRVPAADAARELPAWDRYDEEVGPSELADVVVRADDPRHPAVVDRR